jgi:hypothetical protein
MSQDDDLIYRKDLSEERIQEIQKEAASHHHYKNCITSALVGTGIAFFAALLLRIPFGIIYILVVGLGVAAGYAFYAVGQYLKEKHKDEISQSSDRED